MAQLGSPLRRRGRCDASRATATDLVMLALMLVPVVVIAAWLGWSPVSPLRYAVIVSGATTS
jgi:hypothetical protein